MAGREKKKGFDPLVSGRLDIVLKSHFSKVSREIAAIEALRRYLIIIVIRRVYSGNEISDYSERFLRKQASSFVYKMLRGGSKVYNEAL